PAREEGVVGDRRPELRAVPSGSKRLRQRPCAGRQPRRRCCNATVSSRRQCHRTCSRARFCAQLGKETSLVQSLFKLGSWLYSCLRPCGTTTRRQSATAAPSPCQLECPTGSDCR